MWCSLMQYQKGVIWAAVIQTVVLVSVKRPVDVSGKQIKKLVK